MLNEIIHGDCREVMPTMPDQSFDAIITDPPYELGFMNKAWDKSGIAYDVRVWKECFRLLKPGGYLLSFGGCRTYHRIACAIEDAGFIIHPMIAWVFGSGFPKATNLSKQFDKQAGAEREVVCIAWQGRGNGGKGKSVVLENAGPNLSGKQTVTASATPEAIQWDGWYYGLQSLKPAVEPIYMAQKPPEGKMTDNVLKYGTGAVNIDGCRVEGESWGSRPKYKLTSKGAKGGAWANKDAPPMERLPGETKDPGLGRFPANLIHDGSEEVLAEFPQTVSTSGNKSNRRCSTWEGGAFMPLEGVQGFDDSGTAARFFKCCPWEEEDFAPFYYCAKASKKERGENNNHPTVKPLSLMRYLCRLITPPGGHILDPFAGTGTTIKAAIKEGFFCTGIEKEAEYVNIARHRIVSS